MPSLIPIELVLRGVEQSAYLQAKASEIGARLVGTMDLETFRNDERQIEEELLVALIFALRVEILPALVRVTAAQAQLLGYGSVPEDEIRAALTQSLEDAASRAIGPLAAEVAFAKSRVEAMADSGMSDASLAGVFGNNTVIAALTIRIGQVLRSAAASAVKAAEQAVLLLAQQAKARESRLKTIDWQWITMGDERVCTEIFLTSCEPRHNARKTMDDWEAVGLPGGPQLLCTIFSKSGVSQCRCFLIEAGTLAGTEFGPIDASDAIEAGKKRAAREASRREEVA